VDPHRWACACALEARATAPRRRRLTTSPARARARLRSDRRRPSPTCCPPPPAPLSARPVRKQSGDGRTCGLGFGFATHRARLGVRHEVQQLAGGEAVLRRPLVQRRGQVVLQLEHQLLAAGGRRASDGALRLVRAGRAHRRCSAASRPPPGIASPAFHTLLPPSSNSRGDGGAPGVE
jgi:hypothetical protein